MPCRVFLADDVKEIRVLWRFYLEEEPDMEVVGEAGDGDAAIAGVEATNPDVLVLDLSMPGRDGLEVLQFLQETRPDMPVVVVASSFSAARMEALTRDLGAVTYFEKDNPSEELVAAITDACKLLQDRAA